MALLLPNYKCAIIYDLIETIAADASRYYAIASNPTPNETIPEDEVNVQTTQIDMAWGMLFGKKLSNTDIVPMITYTKWEANTVYSMYDNASNDLDDADFYVIVDPDEIGGDYQIFKCIYNANGDPSTSKPDQLQASTFEKEDGYKWRYITSVPTAVKNKFATATHFPVVANTTIVTGARDYAAVDVCLVANGGTGYRVYHEGTVEGVSNSTLIQIADDASVDNDFYVNSGIYIYNDLLSTGEVRKVTDYVANSSGNFVTLDAAANTDNIVASVSSYLISPYVKFESDGASDPIAYSTVDPQTNAIASVVIVDPGEGIFRATATIQSNTSYGSGANLHPILPPPGGHGSKPAAELQALGMGIYVQFANSEMNTIPTNIQYNRVGIIKDPYAANGAAIGALYTDSTFNQLTIANVSPSMVYSVGTTITGANSGAKGVVAFSNTTQIGLVGDLGWVDGETISNAIGNSTVIDVKSVPDVFHPVITPMFVQNIDNVDRSASGNEGFKFLISL